MKNKETVNIDITMPALGIITFIVFLILKLCNQGNPDFEWLTWFWVWFPLWIPWAVELGLFVLAVLVIIIAKFIQGLFDRS